MSHYAPINETLLAELNAIVGPNNLSTAQTDRQAHAQDVSMHPAQLSEVVVWPETAQQVADLLGWANQRRIAVTPWGAGTSVEGNPIPLFGGLLLSLERLNRLVELHQADMQVTVQAGYRYKALNQRLAADGVFFPPDPGGDATIGGVLANNAAGPKAVKYGAAKDNVYRCQVALADGRLITVGSRSIKQASGYDLLHLFVGSEGTLGIITEATLRLLPVPQASAVVATFPSIETAVEAVVAIKGQGLDPAALEFIDAQTIRRINQMSGLTLASHETLFMEFHAAHTEVLEVGLRQVRQICETVGAISIAMTTDPEEQHNLWQGRYQAYTSLVDSYAVENLKLLTLDTAIPISNYPALVKFAGRALSQHDLVGHMLGHAGDGNMHVIIPYDDDSQTRAMAFNRDLIHYALELVGTATGEHGVGIGKIDYMQAEHGQAYQVMQSLKQTLDPNNILNPGKIFAA